ncbi:MAG: DPP IV N-terminal domain-containing protein, partial [Candidatus Aminicenantes bacterium]|nr:DPP IV N-terminal domain-containing protein [Candidatus Aminicenantes bacterium]
SELYAVTVADPRPRLVKSEELLKLPPLRSPRSSRMFGFGGMGGEMTLDKARKRGLVNQNGDLFLVDLAAGKSRQLMATDEREAGARFTADEQGVAFSLADNLFVISLVDGTIRQLTSFTKKAPPAEKKVDEIEKWYADQQQDLFKELQRGRQAGGMRGGRGEPLPQLSQLPRRKPYILKETQNVGSLQLSPDMQTVTFTVYDSAGEDKSTIVPAYITRSGYTETIDSHAKAAYSGQNAWAGVLSVATGDVKPVDFGQGERKLSPGQIMWSPDGKQCVITASAEDRKDEWLFKLDPATGKTSLIVQVHDDAWVGEFGLANLFWWPDSLSLSFISEKDGYAHLYRTGLDGKDVRPLTSGKFEVRGASLSLDGKRLYLVTNEEHPGETHFYGMPAAGGERTKVTSMPGFNDAVLSPDEKSLAVIHSYA